MFKTPYRYLIGVATIIVLFVLYGYMVNGAVWHKTFSRSFVAFTVKRVLITPSFGFSRVDVYKNYTEFLTPRVFRNLTYKEKTKVLWWYVNQKSVLDARAFLLASYPSQPSSFHDLGHIIGEGLYKEYGDKALGACDPTFSFSCYHGAILSFMREHGADKVGLEQFSREGCMVAGEFNKDGCYHGLGHALMLLDKGSFEVSLRDCDVIVKDSKLLFSCYQGVSMEHAQGSFSGTRFEPRMDDVYYPCNTVAEKYRSACYSEHAVLFAPVEVLYEANSWDAIVAYCALLPYAGDDEKRVCFWRVGITLDAVTGNDIALVKDVCARVEAFYLNCITGFAEQRMRARDIKHAWQACLLLDGGRKISCLTRMKELESVQ